jgi:Cu/Ag efflux protein CusF
MEMPFEVKDDSILKGLKEDQTVEFDKVKTSKGYRITRIRPAK